MNTTKLVRLHEHGRKIPVFVNPAYVTFVAKSSLKDGGTIIGLVADDLGCEVAESVADTAKLIEEGDSIRCINSDSACSASLRNFLGSNQGTAGDTVAGTKHGKTTRRFTRKGTAPRSGSSTSGSGETAGSTIPGERGGQDHDTVNE